MMIAKRLRMINRALWIAAGFLILFSTILAGINVVVRNIFISSFPWAEELCTFAVILLVYLALPYLESSNNQLCIGVIFSIVKSDKGRKVLVYIRGFITMAASALITYYGIIVTYRTMLRMVITPVLQMPKGVFYAIMAACFALTIITWLVILTAKKGIYDE